jgi:hypothetical protein
MTDIAKTSQGSTKKGYSAEIMQVALDEAIVHVPPDYRAAWAASVASKLDFVANGGRWHSRLLLQKLTTGLPPELMPQLVIDALKKNNAVEEDSSPGSSETPKEPEVPAKAAALATPDAAVAPPNPIQKMQEANKERSVLDAVADTCKQLMEASMQGFCDMTYEDEGSYPNFLGGGDLKNPLSYIDSGDGQEVAVLIFGSATIHRNGKLVTTGCLVHEIFTNRSHPQLVTDSAGNECFLSSGRSGCKVAKDEDRYYRAIWVEEGQWIRFFVHEVKKRDDENGDLIYKVMKGADGRLVAVWQNLTRSEFFKVFEAENKPEDDEPPKF